jgi:hypothetical protein
MFAFIGILASGSGCRLKKPVLIFIGISLLFINMVFSVCVAIMSALAPGMKLHNVRGPCILKSELGTQYIPLWLYEMFSRLRLYR